MIMTGSKILATIAIAFSVTQVATGSICPPDSEEDVLFPHESDCTKFYKCSYGEKVELDCPYGLHFNDKKKYCDWPEEAGCESITDKVHSTLARRAATFLLTDECPPESDQDVLLPHESDCTKFYKCWYGEKVELDCPEGLHFNNQKKYCDWPEEAGCENVTEKIYSTLERRAIPLFVVQECPLESDEGVLFPHESDCTKFYKCANGEKVEQDCPEGLHFNKNKNYCDWPEEAGCELVTDKTYNILERRAIPLFLAEECPLESDEDVLLPNESDCGKFYKCTYGEKIEQDCPTGLHFNNNKKVCDWPEDAGCEYKQFV